MSGRARQTGCSAARSTRNRSRSSPSAPFQAADRAPGRSPCRRCVRAPRSSSRARCHRTVASSSSTSAVITARRSPPGTSNVLRTGRTLDRRGSEASPTGRAGRSLTSRPRSRNRRSTGIPLPGTRRSTGNVPAGTASMNVHGSPARCAFDRQRRPAGTSSRAGPRHPELGRCGLMSSRSGSFAWMIRFALHERLRGP